MKKIFLVISLFLIASCNKEEKHQQAAEQFYKYNYWMVNEPFNNAAAQADAKNSQVLQDKANCGYDIAVKIQNGLNEARQLLADAGIKITSMIKAEIPKEELEAANEYYKTTKLGGYISSQAGFMEMSQALKNSQYSEEIKTAFENQPLSPEEKFNLFINYTLKLLPAEEADKYAEFNKLALWDKLANLGSQVETIIKPFTTKTYEVGQYAAEMAKTCPEPGTAPAAAAPTPAPAPKSDAAPAASATPEQAPAAEAAPEATGN